MNTHGITKAYYRKHRNGRRDFPTYEEYVSRSVAMLERVAAFEQLVSTVVVKHGQTFGQILWSNRHIERAAIERAVYGKYAVIGYIAGCEVYGGTL